MDAGGPGTHRRGGFSAGEGKYSFTVTGGEDVVADVGRFRSALWKDLGGSS